LHIPQFLSFGKDMFESGILAGKIGNFIPPELE